MAAPGSRTRTGVRPRRPISSLPDQSAELLLRLWDVLAGAAVWSHSCSQVLLLENVVFDLSSINSV